MNRVKLGQMKIGFDSVGNLTTFASDKAIACKEVVGFVIRSEQAFTFVEKHDFKGMIQRAFCLSGSAEIGLTFSHCFELEVRFWI